MSSNPNRLSGAKPTPKVITFVQNYISPVNALYIFPITIAAVLDIMSPFGPLLMIAAVLVGLLYLFYRWKLKKARAAGMPVKKTTLLLLAGTLFIFSASAVANFANRHDGGALAQWVPKVKTWQDAYLVNIQKDVAIIRQQNVETAQKVDQTNAMLTQMLASFRPQLEKPLVDQIPGYKTLAENEKNALLMLTSKVGVNGIVRYQRLIKAANVYTANKTPENARMVADNLTYIVRVNGKEIEDTKTRKTLMALFLDPETYNYVMGSGRLPADQTLMKQLNIRTDVAVAQMLDDPLGDFIKDLEAKGQVVNEEVVIPAAQRVAAERKETQSAPLQVPPRNGSQPNAAEKSGGAQTKRPSGASQGSNGGYVTF